MHTTNISTYKKRLNLHDARFSRIAHDDAIVAIVFKVILPEGNTLILKICEQAQHYHKEVYFLKYFADVLPVPQIIQTIDPEPDLHGAILMECLPGDLLQAKDLTADLSYEIGSCLARIHKNRVSKYGDFTDPSSMVDDPRPYFTAKFNESLYECEGHLPTELWRKCHKYYFSHVDLLQSVDGPCMIHRDFRPGNILVQNGKLQGIIDWASGRAGFAEDDFCSLELGEWTIDGENKLALLEGYASIRPVPNYTAVMPILLLNRTIAVIGFTVKMGTWDNRDAKFYQRSRKILEGLFI